MSTLYLKRNLEQSKRLAEDYFLFYWKQKLRNEVFIRSAILMAVGFLIAFILTENQIFLIVIISAIIFIIYSAATFFSAKRKYFQILKESKQFDYELTYSPTGLHYKLPTAESNFNWSYFKFYEQNNDVLYLYNDLGNRMIEIISKEKYGEKAYLEIANLIVANVRKK